MIYRTKFNTKLMYSKQVVYFIRTSVVGTFCSLFKSTHEYRFSTSICTELQMQTNQVQIEIYAVSHTHRSTMVLGQRRFVTNERTSEGEMQSTHGELNIETERGECGNDQR